MSRPAGRKMNAELATVRTFASVCPLMLKKQSVDQVGLPILIYRQTTHLHTHQPKCQNTITPVHSHHPHTTAGPKTSCIRDRRHTPSGRHGRAAGRSGAPRHTTVGLAHLEVEVGLIVEVLVLSPQLLGLPDAVQDEVGRPEAVTATACKTCVASLLPIPISIY